MSPLNAVIVQPSLAKYRAPVYRELAAREGIDLRVWYGDEPAITNVVPEGFRAELKPMQIRRVWGQEVRWHGAQLEAAKLADADAVVLSWGSRYLSLPLALRAANRRGMPTVLWGHGYSKAETPLRKRLRNLVGGRATTLLFYDQQTAEAAIAQGWPHERVFVAPNAIDQSPIEQAINHWRREPGLLDRFAQEHHLVDAEPVIFVSRLYRENRVDLLIEAVAKLQAQRPKLTAIVVGDGPERASLSDLAERLGVGPRVRMLGKIFDELKLAPWMLLSRLFVYPAHIGLSLLHAFGYGLPAVTSADRSAQNPEIIALRDGENGQLVPPLNADALASAIDELLTDNKRREQMSEAAKRTVQEHYSLRSMVDGMEAALRGAVALQ